MCSSDLEDSSAIALKNRKQEFADDVDRKRRTIALEMLEPRGIFRLHDFLTVGAPAPLQAAGAIGMAFGPDYYNEMALEYRERRDLMYGAIFAIFYFVLIRPGQKQRKAQDEMIRQVKKGDEIVTSGGIIGTVIQIPAVAEGSNSMEDRLTIKSGESRLVIERGRIARVIRGGGAPSTEG